MTEECDHNYKFQGLAWSYGDQLPGSSAVAILYEDVYYCTRCLKKQYVNTRILGNSYSRRIDGSFPK